MHYERLWEHDAPQTKGHQLTDVPSLSVHLASRESNTGAAVVVCPGGGYRILAATHEGLHVANALNELGISAFVLRYRVAPRYSSKVSLLDGQRAIRFVRHHAERFRVDSRRLGMLGFSAGGHVTLAVGTSAQSERPAAQDPIDRNSSVPNFLVPIYAVSNGAVRGRKADEYHATDTLVDHSTPPTFLVHTHEDNIVPASQSTLFYNALLKARVPAELHVFGFGEHGVGLASGDPDTHEWLSLLRNWLRRSGFLTPKARVAINQKFDFADDLPDIPHMGWITLLPADPNAPIARTRYDPSTNDVISIPAESGPVAGLHTLQIRRISHTWPFDANGEYEAIDQDPPVSMESTTKEISVEVTATGELIPR